ncbi:MAG: hypothetical protein M3Y72_21620 [Acidobacteriota bacterium]|nr:hypothetical protein [Acidobacteriota bacterium]
MKTWAAFSITPMLVTVLFSALKEFTRQDIKAVTQEFNRALDSFRILR